MIGTLFRTLVVVGVALGGGAASVWMAISANAGFGTASIGSWTAYPTLGTPADDPYTRARFARSPELALGSAEGLTFIGDRDGLGQALTTSCDYRVEGTFPAARFWTIHARDDDGAVVTPYAGNRAPALHSYALLRDQDGSSSITVSRHPAPGNWLAVSGERPFTLVLTVYDTTVASTARIAEVELPRITRGACDG
jgi:hypothetical protein